MNIDWGIPYDKFYNHFKYGCSFPPKAEIFSEKDYTEFCNLVEKCIKDDFDYTIEICGTIPSLFQGYPKIIID